MREASRIALSNRHLKTSKQKSRDQAAFRLFGYIKAIKARENLSVKVMT
jgi:hypothetical protein